MYWLDTAILTAQSGSATGSSSPRARRTRGGRSAEPTCSIVMYLVWAGVLLRRPASKGGRRALCAGLYALVRQLESAAENYEQQRVPSRGQGAEEPESGCATRPCAMAFSPVGVGLSYPILLLYSLGHAAVLCLTSIPGSLSRPSCCMCCVRTRLLHASGRCAIGFGDSSTRPLPRLGAAARRPALILSPQPSRGARGRHVASPSSSPRPRCILYRPVSRRNLHDSRTFAGVDSGDRARPTSAVPRCTPRVCRTTGSVLRTRSGRRDW